MGENGMFHVFKSEGPLGPEARFQQESPRRAGARGLSIEIGFFMVRVKFLYVFGEMSIRGSVYQSSVYINRFLLGVGL
jgi:hypothetical protein